MENLNVLKKLLWQVISQKCKPLMEEYASQPKDQEVTDAEKALIELLELKDRKDAFGKDEYYLKEQPLVWKRARQIVKTLI